MSTLDNCPIMNEEGKVTVDENGRVVIPAESLRQQRSVTMLKNGSPMRGYTRVFVHTWKIIASAIVLIGAVGGIVYGVSLWSIEPRFDRAVVERILRADAPLKAAISRIEEHMIRQDLQNAQVGAVYPSRLELREDVARVERAVELLRKELREERVRR